MNDIGKVDYQVYQAIHEFGGNDTAWEHVKMTLRTAEQRRQQLEERQQKTLQAFLQFTVLVADHSNDSHLVAAARRVGKEVELKIAREDGD